MFYHGSIDEKLRFGDVVKGYLSTIPKVTNPFSKDINEPYSIEVQIPQFSVVLDPCCEIGSGMISLSPLEKINSQFWDIAYLAKDMILLNHKGMAKDLFHPATWNKLSDEKKNSALIAAPDYGHKPFFIYEGNPLFPEYTVNRPVKYNEVTDSTTKLPKYEPVRQSTLFTTKHRMINFKTIYRVNCQKIVAPNKTTDKTILDSIVLQLSIETRNLLREKMAYYFEKPPPEDIIET